MKTEKKRWKETRERNKYIKNLTTKEHHHLERLVTNQAHSFIFFSTHTSFPEASTCAHPNRARLWLPLPIVSTLMYVRYKTRLWWTWLFLRSYAHIHIHHLWENNTASREYEMTTKERGRNTLWTRQASFTRTVGVHSESAHRMSVWVRV